MVDADSQDVQTTSAMVYRFVVTSSSSFYSHLFNYDITKMRDRKEVKNRADYKS